MPHFLSHKADGSEVGHGVDVSHVGLLPALPTGWIWTATPGPPWRFTIAIDDGTPRAIELTASDADQLVAARAQRKSEAAAYLALRLAASCATTAGLVQCDEDSQNRMQRRARAAAAAQASGDISWSVRWRRTDNSFSEPMKASAFLAFVGQVDAYVSALLAASWAARDLINAAVDVAAVAAVDVTAGYPSSTI